MRTQSQATRAKSKWEANNVLRVSWTLTAAMILVLFSFETANAFVPAVTPETVVGDPRAITLGDPAPRPVAGTTAVGGEVFLPVSGVVSLPVSGVVSLPVSGVVSLPSTSTTPTGAEASAAVLGLGLIGAAGAFVVIRRRRSS
jgi:MYXO-CTERM domain-containing protein